PPTRAKSSRALRHAQAPPPAPQILPASQPAPSRSIRSIEYWPSNQDAFATCLPRTPLPISAPRYRLAKPHHSCTTWPPPSLPPASLAPGTGSPANSTQQTETVTVTWVRITPALLDFSYRKPVKGCSQFVCLLKCTPGSLRAALGCLASLHLRSQQTPEPGPLPASRLETRHSPLQLSHPASGSFHDARGSSSSGSCPSAPP